MSDAEQKMRAILLNAAKKIRSTKPRSRNWDDEHFRGLCRQLADQFIRLHEEREDGA